MPVTARKARTSDQYDLEARLEAVIDLHLRDMEEHPEMYSAKDRLSAVQYIGMWINRKYGWGDEEVHNAGSAVRKYSGAFLTKPHVVGKQASKSRAESNDSDDDAVA